MPVIRRQDSCHRGLTIACMQSETLASTSSATTKASTPRPVSFGAFCSAHLRPSCTSMRPALPAKWGSQETTANRPPTQACVLAGGHSLLPGQQAGRQRPAGQRWGPVEAAAPAEQPRLQECSHQGLHTGVSLGPGAEYHYSLYLTPQIARMTHLQSSEVDSPCLTSLCQSSASRKHACRLSAILFTCQADVHETGGLHAQL